MDLNPNNRSFSTSSTSSNITRVPSTPLQASLNLNKKALANESLYHVCSNLKTRLEKVPGMKPYLNLAHEVAEKCAEQQVVALTQEQQRRASQSSSGNELNRTSTGGFSINSSNSEFDGFIRNNMFTFAAGVLPVTVNCDPATQIWKFFQQGASLCLLFNIIKPEYSLPIIISDEARICKKSVYDFFLACKSYLEFADEDMLTVSHVFSNSTGDLIRVVHFINMLLDFNPDFKINFEEPEIDVSDSRSKVVREIIETERKFVSDLELLLKYRDEISNAELMANDLILTLFPNLNEIIDFQRRLLVGLECNAAAPPKYQRIGSIFLHAGAAPFKAYEPWTVGQMAAIDLINKEATKLKLSSSLLDPGFELQSYIIKPIQRLCKYPLLLKELLKLSDASWPNYSELIAALQATKEVANHVNEAQRRAENIETLKDLIDRVSNWRGFNLRDQGELLYHGVLGVKDSDSEKEYVAYLFEKIIFFFIEIPPQQKKQILSNRKKSSSSVNVSASSSSTINSNPLELKGRVFISEIYNINASSGHVLIISWSGKRESGSFTLRYKNEESRSQWENCLKSLKQNDEYDIAGDYGTDSNGGSARSSVNSFNNTAMTNGNNRHHSSGSIMNNSRHGSVGNYYYDQDSRSRSFSQPVMHSVNTLLSPMGNLSVDDLVKVNLSFEGDELSLNISASARWDELKDQISTRLKVLEKALPSILKMKYKDEDDDFVVMESHDDWLLALDSLEESDTQKELTIWIS